MNCGVKLARGIFLEEFVDSNLRVAFDDQTLLFGSRFRFLLLPLWFLLHLVLLLQRFLSAALVTVPQPGIGPGRPNWARGCKPRLSANSSTGAQISGLDVGTGHLGDAVPTWFFRPTSAALLPLPWVPPKNSSDLLLPSGASLSKGAKHFNNRVEQIDVRLGKVQWKLNKRIWQAGNWHAVKALGKIVILRCYRRTASGRWSWHLFGPIFLCSWFRFRNVRRNGGTDFLESLDVETDAFGQHLPLRYAIGSEGLLQFRDGSALNVNGADHRLVFFIDGIQQKIRKFAAVFRCLNQSVAVPGMPRDVHRSHWHDFPRDSIADASVGVRDLESM